LYMYKLKIKKGSKVNRTLASPKPVLAPCLALEGWLLKEEGYTNKLTDDGTC
jgi:hypothetical protein